MKISIILTDECIGDLNLNPYPEENQTVALKVTKLLATGKYLIHTRYKDRCNARDSYLFFLFLFEKERWLSLDYIHIL